MKNRSIIKVFLLEVVTLGIYRLYYLIKTRKEMMAYRPGIKILSPWFLLAPVLVVLASVIVFFIVLVASSAPSATNESDPVYLFGILLFYFGLFIAAVLFIAWEWSYSKAVEVVTDNKLPFAIGLLILILVPDGVDILVIQDYFNNLPGHPGAVAAAPPAENLPA